VGSHKASGLRPSTKCIGPRRTANFGSALQVFGQAREDPPFSWHSLVFVQAHEAPLRPGARTAMFGQGLQVFGLLGPSSAQLENSKGKFISAKT